MEARGRGGIPAASGGLEKASVVEWSQQSVRTPDLIYLSTALIWGYLSVSHMTPSFLYQLWLLCLNLLPRITRGNLFWKCWFLDSASRDTNLVKVIFSKHSGQFWWTKFETHWPAVSGRSRGTQSKEKQCPAFSFFLCLPLAPKLSGHMPIMPVHWAREFRSLDSFCPFMCIVGKGIRCPPLLAFALLSCEDARLGVVFILHGLWTNQSSDLVRGAGHCKESFVMDLKLHPFQQLHENIQEEVHLTCVFFLVLKRLLKRFFSFNLWPILYLIRNFDYSFSS